jgi:methionyl-tRNA synthetase
MSLADNANKFVDDNAPWVLAKDESKKQELHDVCTTCINLYKVLITYLSPILPELTKKSAEFLNVDLTWNNLEDKLLATSINTFKALFSRIDIKQVNAMLEDTKKDLQAETKASEKKDSSKKEAKASKEEPQAPKEISFEDFIKVDMRAAKVLNCEEVEGSKKLLRFELDLGNGEKRQIFSGIKTAYPNPSDLIGRFVIIAYNLAPRKMTFGVSEGMILSAAHGNEIFLLSADSGVEPGDKVM